MVRCPWSRGQTLPGIFALPESLTSLGVTSATLSFNILTAENVWQIPKSCLLSRYGTTGKYSKNIPPAEVETPIFTTITCETRLLFWKKFSNSFCISDLDFNKSKQIRLVFFTVDINTKRHIILKDKSHRKWEGPFPNLFFQLLTFNP